MRAHISFAAILSMLIPARHSANRLQAVSGHRTGPGKQTIHSLHNYIHDHRRKDWSKEPWGRRP